jgi:hypothetical protein
VSRVAAFKQIVREELHMTSHQRRRNRRKGGLERFLASRWDDRGCAKQESADENGQDERDNPL